MHWHRNVTSSDLRPRMSQRALKDETANQVSINFFGDGTANNGALLVSQLRNKCPSQIYRSIDPLRVGFLHASAVDMGRHYSVALKGMVMCHLLTSIASHHPRVPDREGVERVSISVRISHTVHGRAGLRYPANYTGALFWYRKVCIRMPTLERELQGLL